MQLTNGALFKYNYKCLFNYFAKCTFGSRSIHKHAPPRKRICIVGAGTAGFYAAQYLLKQLSDSYVDVIEQLPVPFGLVRFGVAPDHQEVKNVINTFTKTAENERFRYFGNVSLGEHVNLQELRENYHAVLLSYGATEDHRLNIPNENAPNVVSARKFVAWYNGLPGAEGLNPNLSGHAVTVVGQGNVAIDVARMLLCPVDALKSTDTTEYALEALSRSKIKHVYVVGRRGPLQAAFTIKELREMLNLPKVQTIWRPEDFTDIPAQVGHLQRPRKRLTELMLKSLAEQNFRGIATSSTAKSSRQFRPVFLRAPKMVVNNEMEFTITQLIHDVATPTEQTERLPADLVLRSIGYKSTCVDGGICFDEKSGRVYNENGRVLIPPNSSSGNIVSGRRSVDKGLYVAGWLGTGPSGVILTTMNTAFAVANTIVADINSKEIDTETVKGGMNYIRHRQKRVVNWKGWQRIDQAESEAGKAKGKPREKITDIEEMLRIAGV